MKTLLVGGGATSSLIGFFLHSRQSTSAMVIWEKEDEVGGRMRTIRNKYTGTPVDIGAQYITVTPEKLNHHKEVYQSLLQYNVIAELKATIKNIKPNDGSTNYVAPNGTSSIVQHFLNNSCSTVRLSHSVRSLNVVDQTIEAETCQGHKERFDAVVLTIPIPEALKLEGNFRNFGDRQNNKKLEGVRFSSRYVLVLTYDHQIRVEWAACYTPTDNMIRYIAIQEKKVGVSDVQSSSVVIHSSVDLGPNDTSQDDDIQSKLLDYVATLFPEWGTPVDVFFYKWHYSQTTTHLRTPTKTFLLNTKPLILLAGDSFNQSNFNSCIESAKEASELLLQNTDQQL